MHGAGRYGEAVNALQRAAAQLPLDLDVYRALVAALDAGGQVADAASARIGIDAIERRRAVDLFEIGRVYARHKQWDAAGHWLERALMIEPGLHVAHICMAWVLRQLGLRHGSGRHACRVYRGQRAFAEARRGRRRRTVLIVCSSGYANVPFRHLVPPALNRVIHWVIDLGAVGIGWGRSRALPPYDIAFNVIGDADLGAFCRAELAQFAERATRPMLNRPERIAETTRERIKGLLDGIRGIYVPTTCRWDGGHRTAGDVHAAIAAAGIGYPVITRPAGEHGGKGVVLLTGPEDAPTPPQAASHDSSATPASSHDSSAALSSSEPPLVPPTGEIYLTAYHEYRSADGYYRKYRVIFIDRQPYPYHLAIGKQWLLHYFSADMLSEPWKLQEERRFLENPRAALGAQAWTALCAIGARMDLDYCGIDFTLLPDGRVLVFETNATMLVHPEVEDDGLRFKNVYIQKIFDALDELMRRRMAAEAAA
ncbi:Carbamoyl-phosphate synthetase large subunit-like ATP-binding domain-containing protein [Bordetella sputigena]